MLSGLWLILEKGLAARPFSTSPCASGGLGHAISAEAQLFAALCSDHNETIAGVDHLGIHAGLPMPQLPQEAALMPPHAMFLCPDPDCFSSKCRVRIIATRASMIPKTALDMTSANV